MNIWKNTKVYTGSFPFYMGRAFWKENIKDTVKLLEPNVLNNCCLKITSANLCKIGLKMRE